MSEWNTIYDAGGNIVGILRLGVAWRKESHQRLGEYDEANIYDNAGNIIARIEDNEVKSVEGSVIGAVRDSELLVEGAVVGKCIGSRTAAAAAIALIFGNLELPP